MMSFGCRFKPIIGKGGELVDAGGCWYTQIHTNTKIHKHAKTHTNIQKQINTNIYEELKKVAILWMQVVANNQLFVGKY